MELLRLWELQAYDLGAELPNRAVEVREVLGASGGSALFGGLGWPGRRRRCVQSVGGWRWRRPGGGLWYGGGHSVEHQGTVCQAWRRQELLFVAPDHPRGMGHGGRWGVGLQELGERRGERLGHHHEVAVEHVGDQAEQRLLVLGELAGAPGEEGVRELRELLAGPGLADAGERQDARERLVVVERYARRCHREIGERQGGGTRKDSADALRAHVDQGDHAEAVLLHLADNRIAARGDRHPPASVARHVFDVSFVGRLVQDPGLD